MNFLVGLWHFCVCYEELAVVGGFVEVVVGTLISVGIVCVCDSDLVR